jgi:hypothetical protein
MCHFPGSSKIFQFSHTFNYSEKNLTSQRKFRYDIADAILRNYCDFFYECGFMGSYWLVLTGSNERFRNFDLFFSLFGRNNLNFNGG